MNTILVVDDQAIFREPLIEALQLGGYQTLEANSPTQAMEVISRRRPDLILLDINMGAVDGISFLRYMRTRHTTRLVPVIIITAHPRRDYMESAAQFGVRDFLLKSSFSLPDLFQRIHTRLTGPQIVVKNPDLFNAPSSHAAAVPAPSPVIPAPPPTAPEPVRLVSHERLLKQASLRALHGSVAEILQLASSQNASLSDLESVIKRDPVIAMRILQAANTAQYLRANPVVNIEEALRVMGFSNVVKVVASSQLLEDVDLRGPAGLVIQRLWHHSIAVGLLMDRMAPPHFKGLAFLVGLCHDLPSLLAIHTLGEEWTNLVEECRDDDVPIQDNLSNMLGIPLERLATLLLEQYQLPDAIRNPIREYHEFYLARRPKEPGDLARILDAANQITMGAGIGWVDSSEIRPLSKDESRLWHEAESLGLDLIPLFVEATEWCTHDGIFPEKFPHQFPEMDDVEIRYLRDSRWQTPDPIESFLGRIAATSTFEETGEFLLPTTGKVLRIASVEISSNMYKHLENVDMPLLFLTRIPQNQPPRHIKHRVLRVPCSMTYLQQTIRAMVDGYLS